MQGQESSSLCKFYASSCLVYYVAHLDSKANWQVAIHVLCDFFAPAHGLQECLSCAIPEQHNCIHCQYASIYCILHPVVKLAVVGLRACGIFSPVSWIESWGFVGSNHSVGVMSCLGQQHLKIFKKNMLLFFCHVAIMFLYLGVSFVICLSVGCGMVLSCSVMVCHFCMLQMPGSKKRINYRTINKIRGKVRFWALSGRIANAALQQKRNEF